MDFHLTDRDDKELLFAFENGDQNAFEEIYSKYWSRLFTEAWKVLEDKELAKDAVQDVFVVLWSKFGQQNQIQSISNFLYRSIRNKTLNHLSRNKVERKFIKYVERYGLDEFDQIDVDAVQVRKHLMETLEERIESAILNLPPKTKAAFELYQNDMSHKEIAEITGSSPGTIKKQISTALQLIRSKLLFLMLLLP